MQKMQQRQQILVKILTDEAVYSQEELQAKLRLQGIETTQATLSRDLRSLGVTKTPADGYRLPGSTREEAPEKESAILGIELSEPLCIIRTRAGHAQMVAAAIDARPCHPILGTIAGYDTVFVALRKDQRPETVSEALDYILENL